MRERESYAYERAMYICMQMRERACEREERRERPQSWHQNAEHWVYYICVYGREHARRQESERKKERERSRSWYQGAYCWDLPIVSVLPLRVRCSVLQCVARCCRVLQHAVCRSVLQGVAVCCSVLQCVAVYYRVLQRVAACSVSQGVARCCRVLQCDAACCSALQCGAVCCSVLQTTQFASGCLTLGSSHVCGKKP